ncbi:MAG TPA: glycosyltransferase, partial [Allosphingosinicella sp.]|nr:glycosyltransferase [Allosphingosinicella sp.]
MRYVRELLLECYSPPSVEVAIVGHNQGRYAEGRIASIVRQTLSARTIAYHDVASDDGSADIASDLSRGAGIDFVAAPANRGKLHKSWLDIAAASDAAYFHIAEGDDDIAPTMLERCVAALEAAPDAAYAFVGVEWIDEEGRPIADHLGYPPSVLGEDYASGGEIPAKRMLASDFLVKNPVLSISSVLWRREMLVKLLEDNERAMNKLSFAYDWLLYIRAARAGYSAVFVPELLCRHRQHGSSFATRADLRRHRSEIEAIYALEKARDLDSRRKDYLATIA